MPAVTQRISSYNGGVSKQSDEKMLPGQVRECYNGFPDATYGMTKRPGFKHLANLSTGTMQSGSTSIAIVMRNTLVASKDQAFIFGMQ